ncbi:MAG: hypothetical protein SGARI_003378 [Bacillariaceae sp.]
MPPSHAANAMNDEEDDQEMHCEIPERIHVIYERLQDLEPQMGYNRFIDIPCKPARREIIELIHSTKHYVFIAKTANMSPKQLQQVAIPHDLYFCNDTFLAAKLAVGGVVECVKAVTDINTRKSTRAIAIVRPPGHHAGRDSAMGFCYFNNVAIGRPSETGNQAGTGTNLNIAFGEGRMTDAEYAATFTHLVLPILCNYKPDLILIACGFDAVKGDLIGDCGLTPNMYYSMTRSLLEVSPKTPLVVALEGGYNVELSALCMEKVALALLDESPSVEEGNDRIVWTSTVSLCRLN